jgi:hypothetical protein
VLGRRREDCKEGDLPVDLKTGDYWKILNEDGSPKLVSYSGKLTETCWHVIVPMDYDGVGFAIANLVNHTVREHEDGTISVLPNDGSSNSILVTGHHGKQWHGYIYNGELKEC